jgi:hypothetical protein
VRISNMSRVAVICQKYGLRKICVRSRYFIAGLRGYHKRSTPSRFMEIISDGIISMLYISKEFKG